MLGNVLLTVSACLLYVVAVHVWPSCEQWWMTDSSTIYLAAAKAFGSEDYWSVVGQMGPTGQGAPGIASFLHFTGANATVPPYLMIAVHIVLVAIAAGVLATSAQHSRFVALAFTIQMLPFVPIIDIQVLSIALAYIGLGLVFAGGNTAASGLVVGLSALCRSTTAIFTPIGTVWFLLNGRIRSACVYLIVALTPLLLWLGMVYVNLGGTVSHFRDLATGVHMRLIPGLKAGGNPGKHVAIATELYTVYRQRIAEGATKQDMYDWDVSEIRRELPGLVSRIPRYLVVNTGYALLGSNKQWCMSLDLSPPKWILRIFSALLVALSVVGAYRMWRTDRSLCITCGLIIGSSLALVELSGANTSAWYFLPASGAFALLWHEAVRRERMPV